MIPFVTPSLAIVFIPESIARDTRAFHFGAHVAYRLTPSVFAHLVHAAERVCSKPIGERPDSQAVEKLIDALQRVYAILASSHPGNAPTDRPEPMPAPLPLLPPPERWWTAEPVRSEFAQLAPDPRLHAAREREERESVAHVDPKRPGTSRTKTAKRSTTPKSVVGPGLFEGDFKPPD